MSLYADITAFLAPFKTEIAGAGGAIISYFFSKGEKLYKVAMVCCGYGMSIFMGPIVADKTNLPATGAGFLIGLFGVAVTYKIFERIRHVSNKTGWDLILQAIAIRIKRK